MTDDSLVVSTALENTLLWRYDMIMNIIFLNRGIYMVH